MPGRTDLNFLEALFGLMLQPGETTEELLSSDDPPYGATILLCILLSFIVPIAAQLYKYGVTVYEPDAIFSLLLVISMSFMFFILLEGIFLRALSIDFSVKQLFSISAYATAPLLLALWLIYFFNFLSTGKLSIFQALLTGTTNSADPFMHIVPVALLIANINVAVVFFYCMRVLGALHTITALFVTFLSLVPFAASLFVGMFIGELARPHTGEIFYRVLLSPSALTAYRF